MSGYSMLESVFAGLSAENWSNGGCQVLIGRMLEVGDILRESDMLNEQPAPALTPPIGIVQGEV